MRKLKLKTRKAIDRARMALMHALDYTEQKEIIVDQAKYEGLSFYNDFSYYNVDNGIEVIWINDINEEDKIGIPGSTIKVCYAFIPNKIWKLYNH